MTLAESNESHATGVNEGNENGGSITWALLIYAFICILKELLKDKSSF